MLTPSSNTMLEPTCAAMLRDLPDVTPHFGRFRVTEISMGAAALQQFSPAPMLEAADLLADSRVQTICWNGTSASWLGFDRDRELCEAITERTGVSATSSVLALCEIFRLTGLSRFGLVTPYVDDIQERIIANLRREGFDCVAERHAGLQENFAFAEILEDTLAAMIREVAKARPDAITVLCTNLRGARLVEEIEREIAIPVYDSVATAVWTSLRLAGIAPNSVKGWGRLFREVS